jgi:hypothetical protein
MCANCTIGHDILQLGYSLPHRLVVCSSLILPILTLCISIFLQHPTKKHKLYTVNKLNPQKFDKTLIAAIFFLIVLGVYSNVREQNAVDQTKLPEKVEESKGFQRWITNLKNKGLESVEADDFRLQEENEIYNTKWMKVYSADDPDRKIEFEETLEAHKDTRKVVFSPSEREFIDHRHEYRGDYAPNEALFYGQKDDKIIDARILDCSTRANCYFDRAFFITNDLFVISEFSRNIHKRDDTTPLCATNETCTYTFKIHVIDLINNQRLVYESKPFEAIWDEIMPEL